MDEVDSVGDINEAGFIGTGNGGSLLAADAGDLLISSLLELDWLDEDEAEESGSNS